MYNERRLIYKCSSCPSILLSLYAGDRACLVYDAGDPPKICSGAGISSSVSLEAKNLVILTFSITNFGKTWVS